MQAPPTNPQMPTYVGARVRATEEAHLVLHAVALNRLPMIHNRLLNVERWSIMEGSIFVWEERVGSRDDSTSSAICRWTDGRRWGPSRVKDEFLIYHENLPALPDGTPQADKDEFIASRLIKQTYSAWVQVNGQRKKWHLVAYYTQKTDKTLTRIFDIPDFAALRGTFSPDKYTSARAPKTRGRSNSNQSEDADDDDSDPSNEGPPPPAPQVPVAGPSNVRAPSPHIPPTSLNDSEHLHPGMMLATSNMQNSDATRAAFPAPGPAAAGPPARREAPPEVNGRAPDDGGGCALAPLVYDRMAPYPPRHPIDSVALRSLDVRMRIL